MMKGICRKDELADIQYNLSPTLILPPPPCETEQDILKKKKKLNDYYLLGRISSLFFFPYSFMNKVEGKAKIYVVKTKYVLWKIPEKKEIESKK